MARYACLYAGILAYIYGGLAAASLLEERSNPWSLWHGQYRALFPGDLGLALALVVGFALVDSTKARTAHAWKVFAMVTGLAVGAVLFAFQISAEEHVRGVMFAPTRIWHQLFVWGLLTALAVAYIVPGVLLALFQPSLRHALLLLLLAVGVAVWVACGVVDAGRGSFLDPAYPIHAPWKPMYQELWRRILR